MTQAAEIAREQALQLLRLQQEVARCFISTYVEIEKVIVLGSRNSPFLVKMAMYLCSYHVSKPTKFGDGSEDAKTIQNSQQVMQQCILC